MTAAAKSPAGVHRGVACPRLKAAVFTLSGANCLATTWFFYYIYFYMRDKFGFGALPNFLLASLLGLVYAVFSIVGGRFAQKAGYFAAIQLGVAVMFFAFLLESRADALWPAIALLVAASIGMCFTWPALEGLMSEGESRLRVRGLVGIYNITWSGTAAAAYFTGGAMQRIWGPRCLFYIPAGLMLLEFAGTIWLERQVNRQPAAAADDSASLVETDAQIQKSSAPPRTFLKMALLANPFAYLAINTIIPVIPTLAASLNLSKAMAGMVCSVWLFARTAAFVLLWLWPKWHYRFPFLAGAFAVMIVCFAAMLRAQGLWLLVLSQAVLGAAFGLIYYSSLFYAMDTGETKGEHGGIHESAIGAGNCVGPAIAAAAIYIFPTRPGSGVLAVCVFLTGGLGGLFWLRRAKTRA